MNGLWWWIDRWLKSTAYTDMTLEEQGAYRNLLDHATLRGGVLPDDDRILAKACGDVIAWARIRAKVLQHFEQRKDGLHNSTLDEVLQQSKRRAKNQAAYRQRVKRRSQTDNATDNGTNNNPANKPASPDLDLSNKDLSTYNQLVPGGARTGASLVQRRRLNSAFEGARLNVPQQLHAEFMRYLNKPGAEKELLTWYEAIDRDWSEGAHRDSSTGGEMFSFWRDRFGEKWPRPVVRRDTTPEWARES